MFENEEGWFIVGTQSPVCCSFIFFCAGPFTCPSVSALARLEAQMDALVSRAAGGFLLLEADVADSEDFFEVVSATNFCV